MANYSKATYVLSFSTNYKKLKIETNSGTLVTEYALDNGNESVSLGVSGTNYVVEVVGDFDTATHEIDVNAGDSLTINSSRMDGIGIMDLRDTNRTTAFKAQFDLACTAFRLKYVAGAFGFKINCPSDKSSCVTEI